MNTGALFQVDTTTVTDDKRFIDGVECTVVPDIVRDAHTGQLVERTIDYFAQDKKGNVWYFGEAAHQYKNGKPVGTAGSWLAGVDGAQPGIVMEAHPKLGDSYFQESAPGVGKDHAQVLSLMGAASVPYGHFDHLLVTLETSILERGRRSPNPTQRASDKSMAPIS